MGLNPLDAALWASAQAAAFDPARYERLDVIDFDHQRRRTSVLVRDAGGPARMVTKGSPEDVLALCVDHPGRACRPCWTSSSTPDPAWWPSPPARPPACRI